MGRRVPRQYLPAEDASCAPGAGGAEAPAQDSEAISFEALGGEDEGASAQDLVEYMPAAMPGQCLSP